MNSKKQHRTHLTPSNNNEEAEMMLRNRQKLCCMCFFLMAEIIVYNLRSLFIEDTSNHVNHGSLLWLEQQRQQQQLIGNSFENNNIRLRGRERISSTNDELQHQHPVDPLSWWKDQADVGTQHYMDNMLPFQPSPYNYQLPPVRTDHTLPEPNQKNKVWAAKQLSIPNFPLVVMVLSSRYNFENRRAIRESWGKNYTANLLFVIGGPLPPTVPETKKEDKDGLVGGGVEELSSTEKLLVALAHDAPPIREETTEWLAKLQQEQDDHQDLLDVMHPETYKSLPYKVDYALTWIYNQTTSSSTSTSTTESSPVLEWVLKVDDDVVVRLELLRTLLLQQHNPHHPIVIGDIVVEAPKAEGGKWAEDPKYEPDFYPPWARGSTGYVLSWPVVQYLAQQRDLYYYQGEDTSLGIWLENATFLSENPSQQQQPLSWIHTAEFVFDKGCEETHIITGHKMNPDEIKGCFDRMGGNALPSHKSRIYNLQSQSIQLHQKVPSYE